MTVRITITSRNDRTILRVDGWLSAEDSSELMRASRDCPRDSILDLSELRHASPEGIDVLARLRARGARLTHIRPLLAMLLENRQGPEPTRSE